MIEKNIQVALRIRPLIPTEITSGCQQCLHCVPNEPQVQVTGTDKAFTFNHVFSPDVDQKTVYDEAVKNLLQHLFEGYNLTILAYGQTGSGKTYTMGTSGSELDNNVGVIPRVVNDIFNQIGKLSDREFTVTVSFMELHQEQLYDLLAPSRSSVDIREDGSGIKIPGLTEVPISSGNEALNCLGKGSSVRSTGATAMNMHSSRSHAIFTISISQQYKDLSKKVSSKFHLVDLAGSERSKKTKTTGAAFKEGVNINKGLLALGNVISALGEEGHSGYITYRNSKLTRLLQESLGGNAITLMIACVSPADYNLEETLCTLRYADRALHIKNKPIVNRNSGEEEVARLKQQVLELQMELSANLLKKNVDQSKNINDYESLVIKNRELTKTVHSAFNANANLLERASIAETARDRMKEKLNELKTEYDELLTSVQEAVKENEVPTVLQLKLNHLEDLGRKISNIQDEHLQNSDEILKHELNENKEFEETKYPSVEGDTTEGDLQASFDEKHEALTMQQVELNKQLQELTRALALKEELVAQLEVNAKNMSMWKGDSHECSLKGKLGALTKEKEDLLKLLADRENKPSTSNTIKADTARLSELDREISNLKKKLPPQENVTKIKEKMNTKLLNLSSEIQNMKQAKVRLIRQLKQTNDQFRLYKAQRQREVMKLQNEGRKFQTRILRMEQLHTKQEHVWRRKVEEANAVAKRLKDTLTVHKTMQEKNPKENVSLKLQQTIDHDLQLAVHTMEAERTLEELIELRTMQTKQLETLKNDPNEDNKEELQKIKLDLTVRNAQIHQLQQKIMASDQENKRKTRWDKVQTVSEAKIGLKYLFSMAAELKKEVNIKDSQIVELETAKVAAEVTIKKLEAQIKEMSSAHEIEIIRLEKDHEDKISIIMSEMGKEEPSKVKEQKKKKKTKDDTNYYELPSEVLDAEFSFEDDFSADPDWKSTPIFRRIQKLKEHTLVPNVPVKRDSEGKPKCSCKGDCSRRCGCLKNKSSCGSVCRCNPSRCQNRVKSESSQSSLSDPCDSSQTSSEF